MEEDGDQHRETEVAPALIAVHPAQQSIAVAVASELRVFNLQYGYSLHFSYSIIIIIIIFYIHC